MAFLQRVEGEVVEGPHAFVSHGRGEISPGIEPVTAKLAANHWFVVYEPGPDATDAAVGGSLGLPVLLAILARRARRARALRVDWRPERLSESFHGRDLFAPVAARLSKGEVVAGEALEHRGEIEQMITPFEIVEIDARIASAAADIRHRSRMKLLDAYILATAQVNGAILITRNTKDFPAEMPGIRIPYTL